MEALWTLSELVAEVTARIAALPAPKNGQVRAVPDERTVRYYGTLGLLARPSATRGRTALYGPRHVAQVVAIKRLQSLGRSLSEIQALWPTLDDQGLTRMSGVAVPEEGPRPEFWRCELDRLALSADVRTSPPVAEVRVGRDLHGRRSGSNPFTTEEAAMSLKLAKTQRGGVDPDGP